MSRVTTENLRSQIEQADAVFRDLMEESTTKELAETLQSFSKCAARCPATAIFVTIGDLGAELAGQIISHSISRTLGQLLLTRWEAEELEGENDAPNASR